MATITSDDRFSSSSSSSNVNSIISSNRFSFPRYVYLEDGGKFIYLNIYIYIGLYIYIYMYIYRERDIHTYIYREI